MTNIFDYKFHDLTGERTHAVSITVQEIVNLPSQLISDIKLLRFKKRSVDKILIAWRKYKLYQEKKIFSGSRKKLLKSLSSLSSLSVRRSVVMTNTVESYVEDEEKKRSTLSLRLAAESHKQMALNNELGDVCIVEQCYILIDTKPESSSLLFSALQNLIIFEELVSILINQLIFHFEVIFLTFACFYFQSKQDFLFNEMVGCKSFIHN